MEFTPLNLVTSYTFLSSAIKLDRFFAVLNANNIKSCAITDELNLMGYPEFNSLSLKNEIKPLYGMKMFLDDNEVNLYILNENGYKNLIKLSHFFSQNHCKTLTFSEIKSHYVDLFEGLACIISSNAPVFLETDEQVLSRQLLGYEKLFNGVFYVGIECYEKDDLKVKKLRNFLKRHPFKSLAFPLIKYIKKDEAIKLKLLDAIKNDYKLDFESENDTFEEGEYYLKTIDQYLELYTEEEIKNTNDLNSFSCFIFKQKRGTLPIFDEKNDSKALLKSKCFEGLNRLNKNEPKYIERLEYELDIINKMGYNDYFLLVQDYVNFAKNNNIIVGPGRGSAAGSLVTYALNITEIDPLEYGLLFERFLNKDRATMPDIDVDFEDIKRDQVLKYIQSKYGENKVTQIATISEIKAKQAIRDIGRIYDLNPIDIDKISKLLVGKDYTLMESYKNLKPFKDFISSDSYYQKIFKLALKIEGLPRQRGIHASGIVINNENLTEKLPMFYDETTKMNVSQFEMNHLENQGFLKMDILSLTNLSSIHLVLDLIKKRKNIDIKFEDIDYKDPNIFKYIINKNLNMGIFQLESVGMNNAIKILKPDCFEDIVNLLALYRPGPMDQINDFAERRHSNKTFSLKNKILENILRSTYGKIVYQEQIMQIAQGIAGFSASKADLFRRAISKKKVEELEDLRNDFVKGCINNGYLEKSAKKLFETIYKFADYGFNKSHSAVYSVITCRMAWLKYYYPQEFYIALLSSVSGTNEIKFSRFLDEFRNLNMQIKVPSINKSSTIFVAEGDQMIMPFTSIKGLTTESIANILQERSYKGEFKSFFDFVLRMIPYKFQEKQLEKLIKSGCFDEFIDNRQALLDKIILVIKNANMIAKSSSFSLFGDEEIVFDENTPENKMTKIFDELELLDIMISYNPLVYLKQNYQNLQTLETLKRYQENKILLIVSTVKKITTKKDNRPMAFITVNDEMSKSSEAIIFPDVFEKYHNLIEKNKIILATVTIETRNGENTLLIKEMEEVNYE